MYDGSSTWKENKEIIVQNIKQKKKLLHWKESYFNQLTVCIGVVSVCAPSSVQSCMIFWQELLNILKVEVLYSLYFCFDSCLADCRIVCSHFSFWLLQDTFKYYWERHFPPWLLWRPSLVAWRITVCNFQYFQAQWNDNSWNSTTCTR